MGPLFKPFQKDSAVIYNALLPVYYNHYFKYSNTSIVIPNINFNNDSNSQKFEDERIQNIKKEKKIKSDNIKKWFSNLIINSEIINPTAQKVIFDLNNQMYH